MGADFLTPKAIANRIKAKGLQKLRWYCQMCEKQCRDENGFKCHCASEAHQRQMMLVAEGSSKFIGNFSKEFESTFVKILSSRHGTKQVHANLVYQDYISDRNHIHMNSTQWSSLTEFVKYLGRKGTCEVEETDKGWFISWIDRSPAVLARQEAVQKRNRAEKSLEERDRKLLEEQIRRAREEADTKARANDASSSSKNPEAGDVDKEKQDNSSPVGDGKEGTVTAEPRLLVRESEDQKISLKMTMKSAPKKLEPPKKLGMSAAFSKATSGGVSKAVVVAAPSVDVKKSNVEKLLEEEKERKRRKDDGFDRDDFKRRK
ncbi:domain of Kin17 curved DNA-binding protein-domain-containing protein [Cladochytrium replicatum]|nr:domain of Kin17 curved DNA-binding protein-domain-containing protein [Cladochytrium replicatum]